jgi:RNA polymerase sigma-70 factor, ECF subfamily
MERSDGALVEDCINGDQEAFRELMVRHQDSVYQLAYRMTQNAADADDLAQEAFIRAYRKLRLYRPQYSFRTWVMTICANLAKNRFRSSARRRHAENEHLEMGNAAADRAADDRKAVVEAALQALPEPYRVPLVLRHVEGLSYEEIARVMSIGLSAAKMRVARGREALEAALSRKGDAT